MLQLLLLAALPMLAPAEVLYQWHEADGSLTFSPTPPPEGSGIKFKVMNTAGAASNEITLADAPQSASILARTAPKPVVPVQQPEPVAPTQVLAYAPTENQASDTDLPTGISRMADSATTAAVEPEKAAGTTEAPLMQASSQKSRNCSDLGKRIVALENRITHSSSDEEMDQVILQISRYQRSYTAHCG